MSAYGTCVAFCLCMTSILLLAPCPWVATAAAPTASQLTNTSTSSDREALLCIKSHLSQPNGSGGALATWNRNNGSLDVCRWQGILCKRRQDSSGARRVVTGLVLEGEGVTGQIPPCISNLTYLTRVHLPFNSLSGPVPPEIGQLRWLRYVNLSSNALTGVVPAELSSCLALRVVSLKNNSFSGGIPAALFKNCSLIQVVDLRINNLDGPIPDLLPYSSSTTSSLWLLGLTKNSLSGEIPSSIGNLTSLVYFLAAQNNLTGSIPGSLATLANIQVIDLTYNSLSGTVPSSIFNLSSLTYLGLGDNGFAGKLPSTMGNNLPNIQSLIISANNLYGDIPKSIANATNLVDIFLQENLLGGVIPSLGTLRSLQTLFLYNNEKLEAGDDWAFLSSLTNCTQLRFLVLDRNRLQGALPSSVANLSKNLEQLVLGSNLITGAIPSGIGDLAGLSLLYLDNNLLSGPIPASIGKLHSMFALNLSKNRLSGKIPTSIANWVQLTELYLQENSLSGAIPAELAGCRNLLALNLSSNALSGPIPAGLFGKLDQLSWFLDLSKNQLTHSIPDEFSNMINLESLNISSNNISGKIPSTLGSCVLLQALRLEANSLEGQIPSSLATLKGIKELDFSSNNLSGKIPEFFELFDSLQYLNLSFNNLDGPIPTKGVVFGNATSSLFLQGNPKLCATTAMLGLPLCTAQNVSERNKNRFLVWFLAIILPCVVVVSLLFVLFLKRWSRKPRLFHESSEESFKMVTYNDLSMATNGFSSGNLIGSGQSSSVYKGSLPAQTGQMMVAVKVFKLGQSSSSSKSFLAECRALRNTRHRNLVKVITACSTCDPFGNEFNALVLEYMPNGTLADHLHTKSPGNGGHLSLGDRIGIAADVASVLEYLHIWSTPPMAHCDIKPSNILLDDDNAAHVGDFGLARFLHAPSSSGGHLNSTSFVGARGSVGYIPPEYGMGSRISTEGDVYSFGIVLLEMLTGKSPTDESFDDGFTLHKYVEEALPQIGEVLDADLCKEIADLSSRTQSQEQATSTEVQKCILQLLNLGLLCSQEAPKDRPNMQYVYSEIVEVKEHFVSCSVKETLQVFS